MILPEGDQFAIHNCDNLHPTLGLPSLPDASVDAVVTDPPAGIEFMGKAWDSFSAKEGTASGRQEDAWGEFGNPYARGATPRYMGRAKASLLPFQDFICDVFTEVYRVLKPGGHALVWAIPRTAHHTAMGLERAGFEIRDVVLHLFGTGFPKSLDVSKAIDRAAGVEREVTGTQETNVGMQGGNFANATTTGTVLRRDKPVTEDAARWQGWGTALKPGAEHWILARKPLDGTVAANVLKHGTGALNIDGTRIGTSKGVPASAARDRIGQTSKGDERGRTTETPGFDPNVGRWPANVTLDEEAARALDAMSGISKSRGHIRHCLPHKSVAKGAEAYKESTGPADVGGASRFFYVAKASKADKTAAGTVVNTHPTVKSTDLMRWLVRLITPPGGLVLDPFMGSGSTGVAALAEGCRFLGIEREAEYADLAAARLGLIEP